MKCEPKKKKTTTSTPKTTTPRKQRGEISIHDLVDAYVQFTMEQSKQSEDASMKFTEGETVPKTVTKPDKEAYTNIDVSATSLELENDEEARKRLEDEMLNRYIVTRPSQAMHKKEHLQNLENFAHLLTHMIRLTAPLPMMIQPLVSHFYERLISVNWRSKILSRFMIESSRGRIKSGYLY